MLLDIDLPSCSRDGMTACAVPSRLSGSGVAVESACGLGLAATHLEARRPATFPSPGSFVAQAGFSIWPILPVSARSMCLIQLGTPSFLCRLYVVNRRGRACLPGDSCAPDHRICPMTKK